jgi:outer membrane protein OmpA-like peptidoglycan-associated protein
MAAALLGVGERIAAELMGGQMEQTYVRGKQGYVILNAVGADALLIVLTTPDAKLGLVFLDIRRRVGELAKIVWGYLPEHGFLDVNARLAFGGLLLLGIADLGLINFKLAPDYAEEQTKLAMGTKPASSARSSAPQPPQVAASSIASTRPTTEPTAVPSPAVLASSEPPPLATVEPTATTEPTPPTPTATAEPVATVAPPATVAATATAAPPTPVEDKPPVASGETPGPVEDVIFDLDGFRLNRAAKTVLEGVVQQLKANPSLKVHVRGHSDRMGSREHNLELSRKRAASVENFLHAGGIPGSRITTEAMGGRKPVDPSNTPTGWARNRRVEIEWR